MRIVLICWLVCACDCLGGIYFTREQQPVPLPTNYDDLNRLVIEFRTLVAREDSTRATFLKLVQGFSYHELTASLEERRRLGFLQYRDYVDLSACYLRLGRFAEAGEILEEAEQVVPEDWPHRFMLLANRATAWHHQGLLQRAIDTQHQVLAAWPTFYPGWTRNILQHYQRAEMFYLRLLEARHLESQRDPGRANTTLDDLFPGLKFVGPSGRYESGILAATQWNRVPYDGIDIVKQLVLWFPFDDRLYWLLGEMCNAHGYASDAYRIMDDLQFRREYRPPELVSHRRILQGAVELPTGWTTNPLLPWLLRAQVAPRGLPGASVAGSACGEIGWALVEYFSQNPTPAPPSPVPTQPSTGQQSATQLQRLLADWKAIVVSFCAGGLVTLLIFYQVGQWKKRAPSAVLNRRLEEQ